jgi:hypothetical protein
MHLFYHNLRLYKKLMLRLMKMSGNMRKINQYLQL